MIFGGAKKKLEAALADCAAACNQRNFAEARKLAEVAMDLADGVKNELELRRQAATVSVNLAIWQGDWPAAQAFQERALNSFIATHGKGCAEAVESRRLLIDLLIERERFPEAEALAKETMGLMPTETIGFFGVQGQLADALGQAGRWPEAIATHRLALTGVRKKFGDNTVGALTFGRILGACLADAGVEFDEAIALAATALNGMPRGYTESGENHICSAAVIATVLQKRGQANELVAFCDETRRVFTIAEGGVTPQLKRAMAKLNRLRADGLAMLGQVDEALREYRNNVRQTELDAGLKHPQLVPALEGLARILRQKGEPLEADNAERRAAAIRNLVTGRKVAPVKQRPLPTLEQGPAVWPRRSLAGIFYLSGVNERLMHSLMQTVSPRLQDPAIGGLRVVMSRESNEAVVLAGNWAKAWEPAVAVAIKRMLAELTQAVALVNSAVGSVERAVDLNPWWAILDGLGVDWWAWPEGERERFSREVCPALPGWGGNATNLVWLGSGVKYDPGVPPSVEPYMRLEFVEKRGLVFAASGPGALLDTWFAAFARHSKLFPFDHYAPLAPPAVTQPIARA